MLWGLKKHTLILALFSLILLAPPLHAQVTWDWALDEAGLYVWTALAITLCAIFIGLAYMAAKILELPVLEAWVKLELNELFISAIITVFCVGLIASANAASQFLTGEPGTVITAAGDFLQNQVYADGQYIYGKLGEAYFNTAKVASYSYTAGISIAIISYSQSASPASGMAPLVAELGQGMDAVANFMMLAAAQHAFITFFGTAAAVMLPVGIVLRTFSLTRKIGGVVLAAVIATSVIYPAGFLLSKEIYGYPGPPANPGYRDEMLSGAANIRVEPADNPPGAEIVCNPYMQRVVSSPLPPTGELGWQITICPIVCLPFAITGLGYGACVTTCFQIVATTYYILKATFPIIAYYTVLAPFADKIGTASNLIPAYYEPLQQWALPAVSKYAVLSLVNFLIPLIIAIVMIRNLAITFGGEPQLYGLSKLV